MPARAHEPLNIHAVLERVLRLAESDAGWAVRLLRDYDPSLPELVGDADRLTQSVWNLVRNAIEAGAANVTLRTRAEHGLRIGEQLHPLVLRLEIVDDGRGVPEELVEQLFLPLVSGRAEGSGLGLALAQQVAREHRGSLAYRSRPGHTVFTLLLPIWWSRGHAMSARIWVVDDDRSVRFVLATALREAGYRVDGFENAARRARRAGRRTARRTCCSPTCACPATTAWCCSTSSRPRIRSCR